MSITAYKAAVAEDTRVLITLEIPDDAITNMNRKDIVNKQTAKHRTNKAFVRQIIDKNGKVYKCAQSINIKKIIYKVGEMVNETTFNMNIDEVCTSGIHFFLDKECAERYDMYIGQMINGKLKSWYDNGQLHTEYIEMYEGNKGIGRSWHINGTLASECTFINRKKHGIERYWYENGLLSYECEYIRGGKYGIEKKWYGNGQLYYTCTYMYGEKHGIERIWYENNKLRLECTYVYGKLDGIMRLWTSYGTLVCQHVYKNNTILKN